MPLSKHCFPNRNKSWFQSFKLSIEQPRVTVMDSWKGEPNFYLKFTSFFLFLPGQNRRPSSGMWDASTGRRGVADHCSPRTLLPYPLPSTRDLGHFCKSSLNTFIYPHCITWVRTHGVLKNRHLIPHPKETLNKSTTSATRYRCVLLLFRHSAKGSVAQKKCTT